MIGSMPGSKQKIRIDKQEMQQYKDRIKRASRLSGRCEEILVSLTFRCWNNRHVFFRVPVAWDDVNTPTSP